MGGPGGHMWHPFDCPDVNSGRDLIGFFQKSAAWLKENSAALKIDGVNLSFRLKESPAAATGFEFVVDRGSMKQLDLDGISADNAHERFPPDAEGNEHGMVNATRTLLSIFNNALPEILPELELLKMTQNSGPFGLYFNTEFVLKKINVKEYPFDFIAIHGVRRFVQKTPRSRSYKEAEVDPNLLNIIKDKVEKYANEEGFKVFTKIDARQTKNINLNEALSTDFTILYNSYLKDPEEPGELGLGEGSTKSLESWLNDVRSNPINKTVTISDYMMQKYPKMDKKQNPYAKNIYMEVLNGTAINQITENPNDVESVIDAAVVMHATRILGNAVLDSLESEEFGRARDQEGVVVKSPNICAGTSFKFTGDFIVGGLATSFREGLIREQQEGSKYVILIPGGFKPPTGGHYSMIKQYDKKSDVVKVFVVTGFKPREGITYEQSRKIFDIYGSFSDKVEFIDADGYPSPMEACYELIKNKNFTSKFVGAVFSLGAGDKDKDPARIKALVNYFEQRPGLIDVEVAVYPPAKALMVDGRPASASRMRDAHREEDWETFKKLLPHESLYNDVIQILMMEDHLQENFFDLTSLFSLVEETITEVSSEKQRKWACAQMGDKVKGKKQLTKKQAEEMCKSEVKEDKEILTDEEEKGELDAGQMEQFVQDKLEALAAEILDAIPGDAEEKGDAMGPILRTIYSDLIDGFNKTKEQVSQGGEGEMLKHVQVAETSMSAGAIQGSMVKPWINFDAEENTQ